MTAYFKISVSFRQNYTAQIGADQMWISRQPASLLFKDSVLFFLFLFFFFLQCTAVQLRCYLRGTIVWIGDDEGGGQVTEV